MASWLVRSPPNRVVRVRVLAGDTVLCSWARHFIVTVPFSTQVYNWVPPNLMLRGNPAIDQHPIQRIGVGGRGRQIYSQSPHATETRISSGLMGHLVRMQTLPNRFNCFLVVSGTRPNLLEHVNFIVKTASNCSKKAWQMVLRRTCITSSFI